MIQEAYCSFEVSKLLKEKGFDEACRSYFINDLGDYRKCAVKITNENCSSKQILRPTHQMVMAWLRDIHNIDIIVPPQFDNSKWTYSAIITILSIPCVEIRLIDNKDKKEEAIEAALKYTLENLI